MALIRASKVKSAVTQVQVGSRTWHKTLGKVKIAFFYSSAVAWPRQSVMEMIWVCWTGQWDDHEHSSDRWDNVLLMTLHLVFPPPPHPGNWKKLSSAWIRRGGWGISSVRLLCTYMEHLWFSANFSHFSIFCCTNSWCCLFPVSVKCLWRDNIWHYGGSLCL